MSFLKCQSSKWLKCTWTNNTCTSLLLGCLAIPPAIVLHCGNVWRSVLVSLDIGNWQQSGRVVFQSRNGQPYRSSREAEIW